MHELSEVLQPLRRVPLQRVDQDEIRSVQLHRPSSWAKIFRRICLFSTERHFQKDVYGAFTGTGLEEWLSAQGVRELVVVGFYAHMCLSTTVREALVRGFQVAVDPEATGARDLEHAVLGRQTADEVRRSALLQLENMGASVASSCIASV